VIQPTGFSTAFATDGEKALARYKAEKFDVVLADIDMKPVDGITLLKQMKVYEYPIKKESLILACLFHDFGKVGDENEPYYVDQTSDWHRDKLGEMYKHNDKLQYMTVGQRGVYMMQRFNIRLECDEYLAILLTAALPKDVKTFGHVNGVWVTTASCGPSWLVASPSDCATTWSLDSSRRPKRIVWHATSTKTFEPSRVVMTGNTFGASTVRR
jgi:hypothetical protein